MDTSNKIEALLFSEGGSLAKKKIAQLLELTPAQVDEGLSKLRARLETGGLTFVVSDT